MNAKFTPARLQQLIDWANNREYQADRQFLIALANRFDRAVIRLFLDRAINERVRPGSRRATNAALQKMFEKHVPVCNFINQDGSIFALGSKGMRIPLRTPRPHYFQ